MKSSAKEPVIIVEGSGTGTKGTTSLPMNLAAYVPDANPEGLMNLICASCAVVRPAELKINWWLLPPLVASPCQFSMLN